MGTKEGGRARGGARLIATAAVVAVVGATAACGSGNEAPTATVPPPPSSPSAATPAAAPASPVPSVPPAPAVGSPSPPPVPAGPPQVPTPGGTTEVFRTPAAEIGPIVWAAEVDPATKEPRSRVDRFPATAPVIYAALPLARLATGTTLAAHWSYNGTPLDMPPGLIVAERDEAMAWAEFHLAQTGDQGWPPGVYAVEIRVDGAPAQAAAVEVAVTP